MSTPQLVPMFAPDGTKGDVPYDRMQDAVKAGFKPAVSMKAPDGSIGDVPADKMPDAAKAGFSVVPLQQQETQHPGFWHNLYSDLSGMIPKGTSYGDQPLPGRVAAAVQSGEQQTLQSSAQDAARKAAGYSAPYRTLAPVAQGLGVNVPGMEQSAQQGDEGGVYGHAAALPTVMAATAGAAKATGAIADVLPSAKRAGSALQNLKATVGDVPIDTAKVGDSALEIYTQSQRGATFPPAVNKLVRRLTSPDSPPMTYEEAKDFQSNISNLSANEKMNLKPNQVRLLGQLNSDMKASLAGAADVAGKGEQFTQAMREYHQAMKLKGYSDAAIDHAWKAALGAAGLYGVAKVFGH